MVEFSNTVAVPTNYGPPVVDFSPLANAPQTYYNGVFNRQQQELNQQRIASGQRQAGLATAFPNGLPTDPRTGQIDYGAVAATLAKFGDVGDAMSVLQQQPAPMSPMFGGQGGQGAGPPPGAPQAPAGAPPAPAQSAPAPAAQAPQAAPTGGTVAAIASGIGAPDTVAQNVARAIGVDPSAPLNDAQQARASKMLQGYASRQGGAGLDRLQSAIFGQESGYGKNNKTSVTGARGPMQIEPGTFKQYATAGENIDVPADNRAVGNRILADYWKRYNGDPARAAVAYFSGPGNVAPAGSPTPWKEDRADPTGKRVSSYVGDVMRKMGVGQLRQAMEPANPRVAQAFSDLNSQPLPPSVNAVSPRATPGTPSGDAAGAAGAPPAPSSPAGAPAPQPQQPAQQPLVPQEPLPPGYTDPAKAMGDLRQAARRMSVDPRPGAAQQAQQLNAWADRIEASIKPVKMGQYDTYVNPANPGQVLAQGPGAAALRGGTQSATSLDADAENYRQTGKLPPNMGRGVQGAAESQRIRERAAELEVESGGNPSDWPGRWQSFATGAAGKRILEQRATNLRLAENEASSLIPRVREASAKINRTQFPSLNSLILAAEKGTGDPNVVKYGLAVSSLIPVYARVLKPTGQITEGDTNRAREILDKAWSQGQIEAALDQMEVELTSAKQALQKTIDESSGKKTETKSQDAGKTSQGGSSSKPSGSISIGGKSLQWSVE